MRLLIFGIDGGTWKVIDPLIRRGELPHLASLIAQGARSILRSTLPPQSAPAWVSLVTGRNPGRHGVFDFWARDLSRYQDGSPPLNQSSLIAGRTLWDYAGAAGMSVGVVSVPVTYPAWPVNGFLISGTLLAPGVNERAAYPPSLAERYGLSLNFPDAYRYGASREDVMVEGPAMMLRRMAVVRDLLAERPCEFLMVVLGETDKAQHDFWRYTEEDCPIEERARYGGVIDEHYRVADSVLGEILAAFGSDALVAVVSDHGAGPYPRRVFHTNAWLGEQGFLRCQRVGGRRGLAVFGRAIRELKRFLPGWLSGRLREHLSLAPLRVVHGLYTGVQSIDWQSTVAYRTPMELPAEGIVVNLEGRQAEGIVPRGEYEAALAAIGDKLAHVTDPETGQRVVEEIHRRDQIYEGPYVEQYAPDLVLVMADGYKSGWGNDSPVFSTVSGDELGQHRGAHSMQGVLILSGSCFRPGHDLGEVSILDVAPTLLHALGLPVPEDMDGRVLLEAFAPDRASAVRYVSPDVVPLVTPQDSSLSAQEQDEIVERLRGLGYVD